MSFILKEKKSFFLGANLHDEVLELIVKKLKEKKVFNANESDKLYDEVLQFSKQFEKKIFTKYDEIVLKNPDTKDFFNTYYTYKL